MTLSKDHQLLIEAYRIVRKVQTNQASPQQLSDWLARVQEESPDVVQLADEHEHEAEVYARDMDRDEIGT
jgi:hypothetical protein